MRIPGDITGSELAKLLKQFGYVITRQTGSHMRLTTNFNGEHHITIPAHNPLKVGTLSAIIGDVAAHFGKTKEDIFKEIF